MPRNAMFACTACRTGNKSGGLCTACREPMVCFGINVTIPKKNNDRAWKRIAKGEQLWDRRKSRHKPWIGRTWRRGRRDTVNVYDPTTHEVVRESANYYAHPLIDLGG